MNTASEIIEAVSSAGGQLWLVDGARLGYRLPENLRPMVEELREHKPEILALLESAPMRPPEPLQDPVQWREAFSQWITTACVAHWRLHGGVSRLWIAFCEWEAAQGEVPCSRFAFEVLLREGWEIDPTRGLVDGLMHRMDVDFTRFTDAQSADRKDSANCKVPVVKYIGRKHAATVESLPVPSHSHVSNRRGEA